LQTHEERIKTIKEDLEQNKYKNKLLRGRDLKRLGKLENDLQTVGSEEHYANSVKITKHSLENQLRRIIEGIPELSLKNDNGRNAIHFHAFRAWFKTQVTNCHQSDYAGP
jgi:hypothetical protein